MIETVNIHLFGQCNLRCRYCFATFPERPRFLDRSQWAQILARLEAAGVRRVTFSGGEPTLHPHLLGIVRDARRVGLQTAIISNGARLTRALIAELDVVGITLDSCDEDVLISLGRRTAKDGSYVARMDTTVQLARELGALVKVNTVVTSANVNADLRPMLLRWRPFKWKPLQFTRITGENDQSAAELEVSRAEFTEFIARHHDVVEAGVWVESETDDVMRSTYVMLDPLGRFFQSTSGSYVVSQPVLDVGVQAALDEVGSYDRAAFEGRGGHVDVRRIVRKNGGAR